MDSLAILCWCLPTNSASRAVQRILGYHIRAIEGDGNLFFRLAQPGGAEAKETLLLSYTGGSLLGVLVQALGNRHLGIVVASVVSLILTISVPFASEVLYIATSGTCTSTGDGNKYRPYLKVRIGIARFEEVVLGLVFLMAVWFALTRRQSGVFNKPTSIAGLAVD